MCCAGLFESTMLSLSQQFVPFTFLFILKKIIVKYVEICVMCKSALHCASIFCLHLSNKVVSFFDIVPSGKFKYHPPLSRCIQGRDNCHLFLNNLFPSIHVCHHLSRDLLHWNQHKFHIFIRRAKQNLRWPGLNFPFGCAKLLIWHSFYLVSSPWMSFQKFFLPKWRCIFWC